MRYVKIATLLLSLALSACAPLTPRGGSSAAEWAPSPNFGVRRANYVILHHTSNDTLAQAQRTLSDPERSVSAHYLVGRDGRLLQLVDEHQRAWHAGASWWGGHTDINSASIGIELDNNGSEPFADAQIDTLLRLLADIQARHRIPRANFIGHADVAPGRKTDPSALFPWRRLAAAGFGLWCESPATPAPPHFDAGLGLVGAWTRRLRRQRPLDGGRRSEYRFRLGGRCWFCRFNNGRLAWCGGDRRRFFHFRFERAQAG